MDVKESLKSKASMKKKLPKFSRQSSHKKKRLGTKWRRPKGLHSKVRLQFRSRKKIVKIGYGTHKELKHVNKQGLKETLVHNLKDIEKIDAKAEGILIAKGVGLKNRIEMVREAIKKNIVIINVKKPEEFLKRIDDGIKKKKEEKTEKKKEKEEKKKELEKKAEEKKKKESAEKGKEEKDDELTEKVKKEEDKKEKDKALTKKE
jgi:large subunit ribosomal protein L32e